MEKIRDEIEFTLSKGIIFDFPQGFFIHFLLKTGRHPAAILSQVVKVEQGQQVCPELGQDIQEEQGE